MCVSLCYSCQHPAAYSVNILYILLFVTSTSNLLLFTIFSLVIYIKIVHKRSNYKTLGVVLPITYKYYNIYIRIYISLAII